MVHSGYEASAVNDTFGSLKGFLSTVRAALLGGAYSDRAAMAALEEESRSTPTLVQLALESASQDRS